MSVEGTIYANEVSKYALTFSDGEYNNLTIHVPDGGKIYGEGGAAGGGNGGGALYVKNTASYDNVSVTIGSNGQIWAGGGGGDNGTDGNSGSSISCFTNSTHNASYNQNNRNYDSNAASNACTAAAPSGSYDVVVTTATPTSVEVVVVVDHLEVDKDGIQPTNTDIHVVRHGLSDVHPRSRITLPVVMEEPVVMVESDKDSAIRVLRDLVILVIVVIQIHVLPLVQIVSEMMEIVVVPVEHGESVHRMVEMPVLHC